MTATCHICGPFKGDLDEHLASESHLDAIRLAFDLQAAVYDPPDCEAKR